MKLEVVILAAGQGTRMKSALPKVLHQVAGRPLLAHVVETAQELSPHRIHIVTGHGADAVRAALADPAIVWVEQTQQLGTGHAVLQALPGIDGDSTVLVLYADVPLTQIETLRTLVALAADAPALLTARLDNPAGYGRILRDPQGVLLGVVEDRDASDAQRAICEINTGLMAAPCADFAAYLPRVGNDNRQREYYLPDVLSLAVSEGRAIASCQADSELEILGVNDRVQLAQVEREYQQRAARALMRAGVTLADPSRIDIRGKVQCASDVFIDVNVILAGDVSLGAGASIGANCVLQDVHVAEDAVIHPMSHLQETRVGAQCSVGPYARLRPGTVLASGAKVGNFVETKKAAIGAGSKVNHLSYIGDCEMGEGVNIGAGTITCNYDGVNKHKTDIGDGVFVGSNSTLVAPLSLGSEGFVGAGSTVTKNVDGGSLAVGRARQRTIAGWERPGGRTEGDS